MSIAMTEREASLIARIKQLESVLTAHNIAIPPPPIAATTQLTAATATATSAVQSSEPSATASTVLPTVREHSLTNSQVARYSRQLILSEIGVSAQQRWSSAKVLVVGAGGLGAPISLYLAAAGVGTIGIIDSDKVEIDNLHRQIIHSEHTLRVPKAESARERCLALNSSITVNAIISAFDETNAMALTKEYDIIVDASDNVATRYLVNDSAILNGKVVVSGSALRMEGQCTVYGYRGGPCYRCLYPTPPPPETVTNCSDGGVLGVVCGIIGCIQALEVLKIAGELPNVNVLSQRLLLFEADATRFRVVNLRPRSKACALCGDKPTIHKLINYPEFCRSAMNDKTVAAIDDLKRLNTTADFSITAKEYSLIASAALTPSAASTSTASIDGTVDVKRGHVLLDVREPVQYAIGHLKGAINIPLRQLRQRLSELSSAVTAVLSATNKPFDNKQQNDKSLSTSSKAGGVPVFVMCRRGIDSVTATSILRQIIAERSAATTNNAANTSANASTSFSTKLNSVIASNAPTSTASTAVSANDATGNLSGLERITAVQNIRGGLQSWYSSVDSTFPIY